MAEIWTEVVRPPGADPATPYNLEDTIACDPEGTLLFIKGMSHGELLMNNRVITPSGAALLWGISFGERDKITEALASESVPLEWVQAGTRRTKEAAAQAGGTIDDLLITTLEYWARKDYGGRLEERYDGSIHLVREEQDDSPENQ